MGECLITKYPDYFGGFRIIQLGTGQSFNISNFYKRYSNLTEDNFFILSAANATGTDSIRVPASGSGRYGYAGFKVRLNKSYNASTGILTFRNQVLNNDNSSRGTADVTAVLVTDPSALIDLGDVNGTLNVTSYANYQNFTADNFLIRSSSTPSFSNSYYYQGYLYDDSGRCTSTIMKSYDASTGILTARIRLQSTDTSGTYSYYNNTSYGSLRIFLNPNV